MSETKILLESPQRILALFGPRDAHVRQIRDVLGVAISHRDGEIKITGEEEAVSKAKDVVERMHALLDQQGAIDSVAIGELLEQVVGKKIGVVPGPIDVINVAKRIVPKTAGQARYVQTIRDHEITFAIGPAGTGKTYLATALAVEALKHHHIRKIVLVRPAVEAGESLGYLPGDINAKINPYLRPLLDSLNEMVDYDLMKRYMEQEVIEVIPLAYMRGRTLNEAFIILDEAQNATVSQMKMFLTRMGQGSRIVISGDTTQVDLPRASASGLTDAIRRLQNIRGIGVIQLGQADIVRHRLVQQIVEAYEEELPHDVGPRLHT
ncbi:MAG: PhoH family protein [Planctomycetaceae bacterium]